MTSARRTVVSGMAAIVALAGFEHGVGEILQGPVAPPGLAFPSWGDAPAFRVLGGEPAMSVVPSLLVSGVLTIVVALAYLACATLYVERRRAGVVLVALSVALLLVGGGFGPPLLGVALAAVAMKLRSPLPWWRRLSPRIRGMLASLWPWTFAACLLAWLALFPGLPVASQSAEFDSLVVVPVVFLAAVVSLLASVAAAFSSDIEQGGTDGSIDTRRLRDTVRLHAGGGRSDRHAPA